MMAAPVHVFSERRDDAGRIDSRVCKCGREVEQIPSLPALIQRAKLRSQKLVNLVGRNLAGAFKPSRCHGESHAGNAVDREMFARIDFDLQSPLSSAAPRPYSLPPRSVASNGGEVHCSMGSGGCTS